MLDDAGGEFHAGHAAHPLGPQPGTVDENVAADVAAIGDDPKNAARLADDLLDADSLLNGSAMLPGTPGIGHGEGIGIDVTITRDEGRAADSIRGNVGKVSFRLLRRERVALDAKALGLCHGAAHLAPARLAAGEPKRAHLLPGDMLAGFLLETIKNGDGILHQPREVLLAA